MIPNKTPYFKVAIKGNGGGLEGGGSEKGRERSSKGSANMFFVKI